MSKAALLNRRDYVLPYLQHRGHWPSADTPEFGELMARLDSLKRLACDEDTRSVRLFVECDIADSDVAPFFGRIDSDEMWYVGRRHVEDDRGDPATTVRVQEGKTLTTDGPFAETKEQLGGFYILDCKDLDEAAQLRSKDPDRRIRID